ncbi:hypothetical protein ACO1NI_14045, partial [Staphylococcus aureus]
APRAFVSRWWASALVVTGLVGGAFGGVIARVDVTPLQKASHAFVASLAGARGESEAVATNAAAPAAGGELQGRAVEAVPAAPM